MQDEDKLMVLKKLEGGEVTFSEAASDIKLMKQLLPVRESFIKEMELTTWKDAEETFPEYTADERLREFVGIDSQNPTEEFLVCLLYLACATKVINRLLLLTIYIVLEISYTHTCETGARNFLHFNLNHGIACARNFLHIHLHPCNCTCV